MTESKKEGHRQLLRDRFVKGEGSSHSEEAILELLLTYAISQKDVQLIAKRLLAEFGDLSAVLEAPIETLSKSEGIKKTSAALLNLVD
jgi:DNA repair protein RadC